MSLSRNAAACATLLLCLFFHSTFGIAEEGSVSPYIDQIKKDMKPKTSGTSEESGSFIEQERRKLKAKEAPDNESYIEELKRKDPSLTGPRGDSSYTEQQKDKLGPGRESAIQALKEGRSELKARREGSIHSAFGFRIGAGASRTITNSEGVSYSSVYGDSWAPDFNFFYEFQPFHSEVFGNIGFMASGGFAYFRGTGRFAFDLPKPPALGGTGLPGGPSFGNDAKTNFSFLTLPATLAANYRFNLAKYVRPYVQVGPTVMGYLESRSDTIPGFHGYSTCLSLSGGVNILLDSFDSATAWDLYEENRIKHYYLTLDYTRLSTLTGDVKFAINALSLGMTFEL